MLVKCDQCGKKFSKKLRYVKEHKHNFCGRACYHQYRREHIDWISRPVTKQDLTMQLKLKKWAELRRQNDILQGNNPKRIY